MQAALYYPFTGPERESFLKTSLFLWDSVDFIVPFKDFRPHGNSSAERDALEIVGRSYVPTETDQKSAHKEFEKICESGTIERFAFELDSPEENYNFYPQKLLPETWQMLRESKLARVVGSGGEVSSASTGPLFGYYMMSVLAVCCANDRKRLVTDNHDPYRALANILVDESAAEPDKADWHGRLIALSLSGPNLADIPLSRLVEIRKGEDQLLRELRRTFLAGVDSTANEICNNADNQNIVRELIDDFSRSMELDLRELKRALGRSATSLILSKEFGFSVCAFAAGIVGAPLTAGISTAAGSIATIGGLTKSLMDYQDRRRKILREHPTSWLMAAGGPRIPIA